MKTILFGLTTLFLLYGCKEKSSTYNIPQSFNTDLPPLPIASSAEPIQKAQTHFIEVLYAPSGWNVNGSLPIANFYDLEQVLDTERRKLIRAGHEVFILIQADGSIAFDAIRNIIRTSVKAGITQFLFSVRHSDKHPNQIEHVIPLDVPVIHGCGPATAILSPLFIKVDSNDQIFIETGPIKEFIEVGSVSRNLPELSRRLAGYAVCARNAAEEPYCQVYIQNSSSYQIFIDVLKTLKEVKIHHYRFTDHLAEDFDGKGYGFPAPPKIHRKPMPPVRRHSRSINQFPGG